MKLVFGLLCSIFVADCANILGIFHVISPSHKKVYTNLVKDLSARGHHLTVLSVHRMDDIHPNVTSIYLKGSEILDYTNLVEQQISQFEMIYTLYSLAIKSGLCQLNQPEVKKFIAEAVPGRYDLILLESLTENPFIFFAEIFDCQVALISTMETSNVIHLLIGNPVNPVINPEMVLPFEPGKLTFLQRMEAWMIHGFVCLATKFNPLIVEITFRKFFPNTKESFNEIYAKRVEFLLQNTNPVLGYTRPITHNTINIGNMHIDPPMEVEEGLRKLLDSSKHGVIYVSFGTNVNTTNLNDDFFSIYANTFKRLKYDILWKLSGRHEKRLEYSKNIYVSDWYPQADLLAHPSVKLFITHCGYLSMEEAIDREVPMIAIPIALDQAKNAYTVRREEIGVYLNYKSLTEEILYDAIMEATKPKYKNNIREFKRLMYDFPMKSRDKAVWWIEYAIRNKGRNKLKDVSPQVPFYQKCCLDVIALIGVIFVFCKKLRSILKRIFKRKVKRE